MMYTKTAAINNRTRAVIRAEKRMKQMKTARVQVFLGYLIIGGVVGASLLLSLLHQLPWPMTFGLTILAVLRLYFLRRETASETEEKKTR